MNRGDAELAKRRNSLIEHTVEGEDGYEKTYFGRIISLRSKGVETQAYVRWHSGYTSWVSIDHLELI